jgi:hypothetical protein
MNGRPATAEELRSFGVSVADSCGNCGEVKPVSDLAFWIQAKHYLEATCSECNSQRACGACGELFADEDADTHGFHRGDKCSEAVYTVSMTALNMELQTLGLTARYVHSGGGCGTIYIGEADTAGMFEYAVGPSDYRSNTGRSDELNVGRDGRSDSEIFFAFNIRPFTAKEVAAAIHSFIQWDRNAEKRRGIK